MQHHLSGAELAGWTGIAFVLACALGVALAAARDARAARRAERTRPAERWQR